MNMQTYAVYLLAIAWNIFCLGATAGIAGDLEVIPPEDVPGRAADTDGSRPLVLLYSSDDGSCRPCLASNEDMRDAAEALGEEIDFATVILNPWKAHFESDAGNVMLQYQSDIGFELTAVPATMMFVDGKPVRIWLGEVGSLTEEIAHTYETAMRQAAAVRRSVSVAVLTEDQAEPYIEAFSRTKPVFLTLSSTDADCSHCLDGNERIEEASRYLSEDYHFARVDFSPWRASVESGFVQKLLGRAGHKLTGLPLSVVIYQGEVKGTVVTNGRDLRQVLAQALPLVLGQ